MIIYEVVTTEQAESDLRGIYEYIAFELLSPENAARQLDRLEENILGLETFPEKFRGYEKEPWKSRGLRVMPVDNYLVFYISDKEAETVTVIRVMYDGRDVDNQLICHTKM
jgi:addiction module toxin, relE/stbE family